ncbi:DUF2750 domain-containing protein [Actinoplanes couchii]|uniref:DUF2750 domain-containing protein n=1 Tax=Actinoplanes couchii TaxID=403638 RepID=A0ABQ3XKA4_9ACTN|nr:DUF2750 domain-containing protein [Actinoplanes couchii]MDR6320520.1 hypothetical protein [Actinoplanes couchii]GID58925.1 hypothetical protein Aco03nite_073290 [Actinoplanes couchii]
MASDDISRREAEQLLKLDAEARVTRTFEAIAAKGELWVWGDEGDILFTEDGRRRNLLPIWPHATVARLENEGDVDGEHAIRIRTDVFLKEWIPQLEEDHADIAIFPVEEVNAAVIPLADFRARLSTRR